MSDMSLHEAKQIAAKLEALTRVFLDSEIENRRGLLSQLEDLRETLSPTKVSFASMAQKREYEALLERIGLLLENQKAEIDEMSFKIREEYISDLKKLGESTLVSWLEPAAKEYEEKYEMLEMQFDKLKDSPINWFVLGCVFLAGFLVGAAAVALAVF